MLEPENNMQNKSYERSNQRFKNLLVLLFQPLSGFADASHLGMCPCPGKLGVNSLAPLSYGLIRFKF